MYETPSLHKFGYSSEKLKLREYQELKDMIKSQEKIAQITHFKLKEDLQRDFENDIENQEKLIEEKMLYIFITRTIFGMASNFSNSSKVLLYFNFILMVNGHLA